LGEWEGTPYAHHALPVSTGPILIQSALGSCECVGVVGATLGGGISSLQGVRGLLLDALESVRVVTPIGALVTASRTENPDLFWALRGAGSNFGIVTSATYKVFDLTNRGDAMNADFVFPASANRSFFEIMRSFDSSLPKELGITGVAFFNRSSNEVTLLTPFNNKS
jgi:FAD/FMN-containing dehydrogenase